MPGKWQTCERPNGTSYECGKRATDALSGMVYDQETTCRFTGDTTCGRPVATVCPATIFPATIFLATIFLASFFLASFFPGSKDINLEMVRQGYAVVFDAFLPADMKKTCRAAEADARKARKGIWQGKFINPGDWRDGKRLACE